MTLTEEQLENMVKTSNCSVEGEVPARQRVITKKDPKALNKTETFFMQRNLVPMLYDKKALTIIKQPEPIILQAAPKITYKPDFIVITNDLQVWCYEVKAKNGKWTGEKEDDSLKMRLLKGTRPHIKMFLALVDVRAREVWQQEITLTGRTRKAQC